jgi:hypothetical protein
MIARSRATTPEGGVSSRRKSSRTLPSVAHSFGRQALLGFVFGWAVLGLFACDSNPTPHPASDATVKQDTSRGDSDPNITAPTDQAGCDAVGGFWTGNDCQTESDAPDAVADPDAADADGADSTDVTDSADGDAGPEDSDTGEPDGSTSDTDDQDYRYDGAGGAGGQTPR